MKPPLRTRRARGLPSRPERWSTPALRFYRFYRFGKHYRAGLQAPERVSKVRIQGSDVSDQRVDKAPAARPRKADEGCSVAATRERRPQLARQPVNLKHEGGRLVPTARNRPAPSTRHEPLRHWRRRRVPHTMAWSSAAQKNAWGGDCPALQGRRGFAASSPSGLPSRPSRIP
jgi:hypothetical protein